MVNMRKRILQVAECEFKEGCLSIKVEYITNKRNGNISGVKAAAALLKPTAVSLCSPIGHIPKT